jgi:hypothetical protein
MKIEGRNLYLSSKYTKTQVRKYCSSSLPFVHSVTDDLRTVIFEIRYDTSLHAGLPQII